MKPWKPWPPERRSLGGSCGSNSAHCGCWATCPPWKIAPNAARRWQPPAASPSAKSKAACYVPSAAAGKRQVIAVSAGVLRIMAQMADLATPHLAPPGDRPAEPRRTPRRVEPLPRQPIGPKTSHAPIPRRPVEHAKTTARHAAADARADAENATTRTSRMSLRIGLTRDCSRSDAAARHGSCQGRHSQPWRTQRPAEDRTGLLAGAERLLAGSRSGWPAARACRRAPAVPPPIRPPSPAAPRRRSRRAAVLSAATDRPAYTRSLRRRRRRDGVPLPRRPPAAAPAARRRRPSTPGTAAVGGRSRRQGRQPSAPPVAPSASVGEGGRQAEVGRRRRRLRLGQPLAGRDVEEAS